ncbi:InlB B-repeat-containing protein, partial [Candidatus Symbiothrix dinenymphae]|uniref:InlB B-repeat-containing protein n=1 Tax=Candidatus Symbiothrix dinenymphae TaxID=467085 RepID=UPI000AAA8A2E
PVKIPPEIAGPCLYDTLLYARWTQAIPVVQSFETVSADWHLANGSEPNTWHRGTAAGGTAASSALYITNNAGTGAYAYDQLLSSVVHCYSDILFTAAPGKTYSIGFDWKSNCHPADGLEVFLTSTTTTPVAGTRLTANASTTLLTSHGGNSNGWRYKRFVITGYTVDTPKRLIFTWYNSAGSGSTVPIAIDNISVSVSDSIPITLQTNANFTIYENQQHAGWTDNGAGMPTIVGTKVVNVIEGPALEPLPTPFRRGYAHVGWMSQANPPQQYILYPSSPPDSLFYPGVIMDAKWALLPYDIIYHHNGGYFDSPFVGGPLYGNRNYTRLGLLGPDSITHYTIVTDTVLHPAEHPEGKEFLGWYTDPTLANRLGNNDDALHSTDNRIGQLDVYAKWKDPLIYYGSLFDGHLIDAYLNNPNEPDDPLDTVRPYSSRVGIPNPQALKAVRNGYTFASWNLLGGVPVGPIPPVSVGAAPDTTVWATWTRVEYEIKYVMNGGAFRDPLGLSGGRRDSVLTYNIELDSVLGHPEKLGSVFDGWYYNTVRGTTGWGPGSNMVRISAGGDTIKKGNFGDTTVYAKWDPTRWAINYENMQNGYFRGTTHPTYYTTDAGCILEEPVRSGYAFNGWYITLSDPQSRVVEIPPGNARAYTLYADWIAGAFTETFTEPYDGISPVYHDDWRVVNTLGTEFQTNIWSINASYNNSDDYFSGSAYITTPTLPGLADYDRSVPSVVHLWRNITIQTDSIFIISFDWKGGGEADRDYLKVYLANASQIPQVGSLIPETTEGYQLIGQYSNQSAGWNKVIQKLYLSRADVGVANVPRILVLSWANDANNRGESPSIAIDNVSIKRNEHVPVYFDSKNGLPVITQPVLQGTSAVYVAPTQTLARRDYVFETWIDSLTREPFLVSDVEILDTTWLLAKWGLQHYQINYNMGGGRFRIPGNGGLYGESGVRDSVGFFTVESEFVLPIPVRTGWLFTGWTTGGTQIDAIHAGAWHTDINLTANWRRHTITYMLDGGQFLNPAVDSISTYAYDSVTVLSQNVVRDQFVFDGWADADPLTPPYLYTTIKSISAYNAQDTVLWAKWLRACTVRFNTLEVSATPVPDQIVGRTRHATKPSPAPTLTDYVFFDNWYSDTAYTQRWDFDSIPVLNDTMLYAKWGHIDFLETFDAGSPYLADWTYASEGQPNRWVRGGATNHGDVLSAYITNDATGANNAYDMERASISYLYHDMRMPEASEDFLLSFDWRSAGEGSTVVGEGGTVAGKDYLAVYLENLTVTPVPGRKIPSATPIGVFGDYGKERAGWHSQEVIVVPHENANTYKRLIFAWINDDRAGMQPPAAIDNVTIATAMKYSVRFFLTPGVLMDALLLGRNQKIERPSDPERRGYEFVNWHSTNDLPWNFETIVENDVILTAQWQRIQYTIRYTDPGEVSLPTTYDVTTNRSLITTKHGSTFLGWYTNPEFTGDPIIKLENSVGNLRLYAKWQVDEYAIDYHVESNSVLNPTSYNISTLPIYLREPTKSRSAFEGWYTTPDYAEGSQIEIIPADTTGNITLYPKWGPAVLVSFKDGSTVVATKSVKKGGEIPLPQTP